MFYAYLFVCLWGVLVDFLLSYKLSLKISETDFALVSLELNLDWMVVGVFGTCVCECLSYIDSV